MCPSHESDITTDKRAGVWLGLSVPSLVMGQITVPCCPGGRAQVDGQIRIISA